MKFSQFVDLFTVALYHYNEFERSTYHRLGQVLELYEIPFKGSWEDLLFDDYDFSSRVSSSRNIGSIDAQAVRISAEGVRWVEGTVGEDNVASYLEQHGAKNPFEPLIAVPAQKVTPVETVPAADRIVRLDHNKPEYRDISTGLADLYEQVRSDNQVGETAEERDRLLRSLKSARELWEAAELHVVQLQVGVLLAVEDATAAITKIGKSVGAALLVDLIKRFIKNASGLDF